MRGEGGMTQRDQGEALISALEGISHCIEKSGTTAVLPTILIGTLNVAQMFFTISSSFNPFRVCEYWQSTSWRAKLRPSKLIVWLLSSTCRAYVSVCTVAASFPSTSTVTTVLAVKGRAVPVPSPLNDKRTDAHRSSIDARTSTLCQKP